MTQIEQFYTRAGINIWTVVSVRQSGQITAYKAYLAREKIDFNGTTIYSGEELFTALDRKALRSKALCSPRMISMQELDDFMIYWS